MVLVVLFAALSAAPTVASGMEVVDSYDTHDAMASPSLLAAFTSARQRRVRTSKCDCSQDSNCCDCQPISGCSDDDSVGPLCAGLPGNCYPCCPTYAQAVAYNNGQSCDYSTQYRTNSATGSSYANCASLTNCVLGTSYQIVAPQQSVNRVCTSVSQCVGATPYQQTPPTLTTDRICTSVVNNCTNGTYQKNPPSSVSSEVCSNVTVCVQNSTFQTVAPTISTNRVCGGVVTPCVNGSTYETAPPTLTSNRNCTHVSTCTLNVTYQSSSPTLTSDRVCGHYVQNCTGSTPYESAAPTLTSNRACTSVSNQCVLNISYLTVAPTATSIGICSPTTQCTLNFTYASAPATVTSDRNCSNVSQCALNVNFQSSPPTLTSDRQCGNLVSNCTLGVTYESSPPTVTTDRKCDNNVTSCVIGVNYMSVAPTLTSNRICGHTVTNCTLGVTYQSSAPTTSSNRHCSNVSTCELGVNFQSTPPTLISNRVCGNTVSNCTLGETYEVRPPSQTSDRICSHVSTCALGSTYETSRPTITSNRVCSAVSLCVLGTSFQVRAPTLSSNRVCTNVSACHVGTNFQSTAPTLTSNRQCHNHCTPCIWNSTYQTIAPTQTSNRECSPVAKCTLGRTYQKQPPTVTSNRVCLEITTCTLEQTEILAATLTSDTVCLNRCNRTQYIKHNHTPNATCSPITKCPFGQHQVRKPVPGISNRVCRPGQPAATIPTSTSTMSSGTVAGIVIGVLAAIIILIGGVAVSNRPRSKKTAEDETEMNLIGDEPIPSVGELGTAHHVLEGWGVDIGVFAFQKQLKEGAFGQVWKATKLHGGTDCVVRMLPNDFVPINTPVGAEQFKNECEFLQLLRHTNLVGLLGGGVTNDRNPFVIVEFVPNGSLRDILQDVQRQFDWSTRTQVAQQIANGMLYLHEMSIVHGNLTSHACLLTSRMEAKISNFGLRRLVGAKDPVRPDATGSAEITRAIFLKSVRWMAPELVFEASPTSPETDVFSFGVILWELATRMLPWGDFGEKDDLDLLWKIEAALRADKKLLLPRGFGNDHPDYTETLEQCWGVSPRTRIPFSQIALQLGANSPETVNSSGSVDVPPRNNVESWRFATENPRSNEYEDECDLNPFLTT